ncbi:MAG TPA: nuclear transport factor 2 family protein [Actinophytocola sp.]|uniref:nuclear transport factor 2 family protein n=1 Tax=Actinophytocola sp. TaxID=1872138 RepID=UPI002DDD4D1D|nr:nuclear transport factor 2 family protein [Actinophytocola sp.]HEV2779896.1 nuclear transport factor 2 family protein [Actinophytocola sp.]
MTDADVLTRMLHAIDARDWATLRASFTDEVRTDYTSLFGGEPETITADQLVARWRPLMLGYDATLHLTGPVLVSGDRLDAHVTAHHWLADDGWTVYGHYVARVAGGQIAELTLQTFHQEGNRELPALAAERANAST